MPHLKAIVCSYFDAKGRDSTFTNCLTLIKTGDGLSKTYVQDMYSHKYKSLAETPFERYLYFIAFKNSREDTPEYLKFFKSYLDTTPSWEGDEDNSDVLHPSRQVPLEYPYFYNHTYVHFLPGGYLNTRTVRISFLGNSKFTFLNETTLEEW